MRPIPATSLGHAHGLLRAIEQRGRLRTDEFVTEFSLEELFPPDLENALGRLRHFISYGRAAGLVKEDRGVVELTDVGRRYVRAGDADAPFEISSQQAEWLRRQLREKHMTDSIFHGLAIGLSLLASCPPPSRVSTMDFGRAMAYLGRAGWDNDNTLLIQGERHLILLQDLELIDGEHRLTPTGEQQRADLTLPVHMGLIDLAAQLNPGGATAVREAAVQEWAAVPETPAAETPLAAAEEAQDGEEGVENGYHTVGQWAIADDESPRPPIVPRANAPQYDSPPAVTPGDPLAASEGFAIDSPEPDFPPDVTVVTPNPAGLRPPSASEPPPSAPADAPPIPAGSEARPGPAPESGSVPPAAAVSPPAAPDQAGSPATPSGSAPPPAAAPPRAPVDQPVLPDPVVPPPVTPAAGPPPLPSGSPPAAPGVAPPPRPNLTIIEPMRAPSAAPSFVETGAIRAAAEAAGLRLPDGVYANVAAALNAGKHLLLTGVRGGGKTWLALAVTRAAAQAGRARGATVVTGAPKPEVVIDAAARGRWVIVDELDQADPDEALSPLSSFLAGVPVTLDGEEAAPADGWRIVATWNGAPPRAAILRRFAIVEVQPPEPGDLQRLLHQAASGDQAAVGAAEQLAETGLGTGVLLDAARHAAARNAVSPTDEPTLAREVFDAYAAPLQDA